MTMNTSRVQMLSPELSPSKSQKSLLSDPGSLLSEEEVKEALLSSSQYQNCCHSESTLRDIDILEIRDAPIYRYSIEVFSEDRRKQWTTVPYKGEPLSQEVYDPAYADIWTLNVPPTVHFGKGKKTVEVPGSTTVVNCAQCNGIGSVQCGQCGGSQTNPCSSCVGYGFGQVMMEDGQAGRIVCPSCAGKGRIPCSPCGKKGVMLCATCKGTRKVKNYERLDVSWKTSLETSNGRSSGKIKLPPKILGNLRGTLIVENCSSIPKKLKSFDTFSELLDQELTKHNLGTSHRILEIRQRVYSIPATEVSYHYKGSSEPGIFLIYGHENLVYFPQGHPRKYKCNIL